MTPSPQTDGKSRPQGSAKRRPGWLGAGAVGALVLGGILVFLVVVADARFEAATFGLVGVAAALGFFLATLRRMAVVLARPEVDTLLAMEGRAFGTRELLAEKRRSLRAIKELDFDHAMGKLSDADYREVRKRYEVRALEVLAAVEGAQNLHPDLARDLERLESRTDEASSVVAAAANDASAGSDSTSVCPECDASNDADARFCKHCGAKLKS